MAARVFISHDAGDAALASAVGAYLTQCLGVEVGASSLPGREPEGGDDSVAGLKDALSNADVVLGLLTPGSLAGSTVAFSLGAAWALGKPLVLLLDPDGESEELFLPMGHGEAVVLTPEALLELAESLGARLGLDAVIDSDAINALRSVFPEWEPAPPESTRPPPAEIETDLRETEAGATSGSIPPPPQVGDTQQVWPLDADGVPRRPDADATPADTTAVGSPSFAEAEAPPAAVETPPPAAVAPPPAEVETPPPAAVAPPPAKVEAPPPAAVEPAAALPEPAATPSASTVPPRPSHPPVPIAAPGGNGAQPPAAAAEGELPNAIASLEAGRAFSDCVYHREQGGPYAAELDATFGRFLQTLGGNWSVLRTLEDLDVWMEAADNVLDSLGDGQEGVRYWYEVGYQLATMLNLASEGADPDELQEVWQGSWEALSEAALEVGFRGDAIQAMRAALDNLIGPEDQRDYTNVGKVQDQIRQQAAEA